MSIFDVARQLEERTGCAVFVWQYLPGGGVLGDENDAKMRKLVEENGLELIHVLDREVTPRGTLALCSFKEDMLSGTMHLYQLSNALHERMWNPGEASQSSGGMACRT